jgi:3-dehydroquinate synthase class II
MFYVTLNAKTIVGEVKTNNFVMAISIVKTALKKYTTTIENKTTINMVTEDGNTASIVTDEQLDIEVIEFYLELD